jgi:hypothetical protein
MYSYFVSSSEDGEPGCSVTLRKQKYCLTLKCRKGFFQTSFKNGEDNGEIMGGGTKMGDEI